MLYVMMVIMMINIYDNDVYDDDDDVDDADPLRGRREKHNGGGKDTRDTMERDRVHTVMQCFSDHIPPASKHGGWAPHMSRPDGKVQMS